MAKSDLLENLFTSVRAQAKARKLTDPADKVAVLRGSLLPHQVRLERDIATAIATGDKLTRWFSVISPRQTGKSTGVMLITCIRCFEKPGAEWVVIGLTRPSITRIYWNPLKKLNEDLELGLKFHDQAMTVTFPNGSRIWFVGGETISEVEKLRGGRYDGAVVDECKSYSESVFQTLLEEILQPALNTKKGPLIVIGTPGDHMAGEFYLATCQPAVTYDTPKGKRVSNRLSGVKGPGKWVLHVWTLADNTACPHLWEEATNFKELNGWADDHPVWQREYLGRWVSTDRYRVYRYAPHRHDYVPSGDGRFGLEDGHEWRTVCGVDLGTRDGCAIVVWAYSPTAPGLWEVYSDVKRTEKGQKYPLREFVEWYREIEQSFGPYEAAVVDAKAPLIIDTLADDYGLFLEPAEQKLKPDHIELMNLDLDRRLIRVLSSSELSKEMVENRWDSEALAKGKREEDRRVPNDVCDAALYAFRWCNHRKAKPAPPALKVGTPAWWAAYAAKELEEAKKAARARASQDDFARLDADWWEN